MPTATLNRSRSDRGADRYLDLVREFPLRPIKNDREHRQAAKMVRDLSREHGHAVDDYVAVLVGLIVKYEQEAGYRIDTSHITPAETIRFILEQRDMSVNAFAKEIKMSQSALNDMLNGKRGWSKSAIVKISDYFKLNPAMFLR